jgi:asparagine synthase (glutamine-hydrolysing)
MSRHHSRKVTTFCLGYEDRPDGQFAGKMQDIYFAREMSRRLGTEHHEFIITADQFAETMPAVLSAFDEPFSGTISTYFLSILIKKHVKVALSGDGADELFGSYLAHRLAFPIDKYMELTDRVQGKIEWRDLSEEERLAFRPFDNRESFLFLQSIAASSISAWRNSLSVFNDKEKQQLLTKKFLVAMGTPPENIYELLEQSLTAKDTLNRSLEIDQKELLPNQVLPFVDRLSMAHSIEVRVPFLDYRIIEFANRLPGKLKILNGVVKHVHKLAMERLIQRDLVERPKEGFVQPIYSWMHGRLRGWTLEILDGLPRDMFNSEYVRDLINLFRAGNQDVNAKIWNLACFGLWFRGVSH